MDDESYGPRVGARIREARLSRGLNRSQLAREIGTAWAVVNRWEKGVTLPSVASIIRIAEVLQVSFDQLLAETNPDPAPDVDRALAFKRLLGPRNASRSDRDPVTSAHVTNPDEP